MADEGNAVSSEIDNTGASDLWLFDDCEWHNASLGYTPAAGSTMELYIVEQDLDGTGWEDGEDGTIDPPSTNLAGVFQMRSSTAAQTHIIRDVRIPPAKFKYVVINKSGGTLPSSGNTVRRTPHRDQTL